MATSFKKLLIEKYQKGEKAFAFLMDPDEYSDTEAEKAVNQAVNAGVDYIFIGGSLLTRNRIDTCIDAVRKQTTLPSVLFPGSHLQFHQGADAILLLSLISGRNPDLLIGRHVEVAPSIRKSQIEVVPTGYMLIDGGKPTSVSYISNTTPIPADKPEIAASTALAGEQLGLQCIYMDAGSGALTPISPQMIETVKKHINVPLIIGGGIKNDKAISDACNAGADVIVVGNALQKSTNGLPGFVKAVKGKV